MPAAFGAAVTALCACAALTPQASLAVEIDRPGQEVVFQRDSKVMLWDSFNGVRTLATGSQPTISTDGRFVAFISATAGSCGPVALYDIRARREATPAAIGDSQCAGNPALSGDGRFLVWDQASSGADRDIQMFDIAAGKRVGIGAPVNGPASESSPSLTDDGSSLGFISDRNGNGDFFLADVRDPAAPIQLPTRGGDFAIKSDAYLSPSGHEVLYTVDGNAVHHQNLLEGYGGRIPATVPTFTPSLATDTIGMVAVILPGHTDSDVISYYGGDLYDVRNEFYAHPELINSDKNESYPGRASAVIHDYKRPSMSMECRPDSAVQITCNVNASEIVKVKLRARTKDDASIPKTAKVNGDFDILKVKFEEPASGRVQVVARVVDLAGRKRTVTDRTRIGSATG